MWTCVIFVDAPSTPIRNWEQSNWQKTGNLSVTPRFWRMLIAIRETQDGNGCTGEQCSRQAWDKFGSSIRKIANVVTGGHGTVFLFDNDVSKFVASSKEMAIDGQVFLAPRPLGKSGDIYRILAGNRFEQSNWPLMDWLSGSAIFFASTSASSYCKSILEALSTSNYSTANNLVYRVRFDLTSFAYLLDEAILYIYVDSLKQPMTADPWLFFNRSIDVELTVATVAEYLAGLEIQTFVSRDIQSCYNWIDQNVLPSDAQLFNFSH